jgi:subtilisin family serine protease
MCTDRRCCCNSTLNPCGSDHDDDVPPLDVDAEQLGDGYSGFVIVRMSRDFSAGDHRDLRELAVDRGADALVELIDELGRPPSTRLITSLSPDEILRLEEEAAGTPWRPLNSLTQYWRVDLRQSHEPLDEVARRFARVREVELAYPESVVTDPVVNAADDPFSAQQGYLDAAPTGIDARWAWTQTGGEGQGVGVVDLEQGWRLAHEDLTGKAPALIYNHNLDGVGGYVGNHGTAVMGVLAADDNTRGVVGIAPSLTSLRATSHFDGATTGHVADAAVAALPYMNAGDVLLLEVQRGALLLPTETDPADHAAIRLATARGIIVVEAAGNGSQPLDDWPGPAGPFRLRRGHTDFRDSGAIMVGACRSAVVGGTAHERAGSSNFGNRVDCYGWGEHVTSCGYGDLTPGAGSDADYTATFDGTSSASPIVAGAAVLIQSLYRNATGTRLSPGQMRSILAIPANGTPQGGARAGNIGVMPNVRRIGQNVLGLVPDVYLRDAVGDNGVVPHLGALSTSPDVILQPVPVANHSTAFGEGSGTENDATLGLQAETGQDNTIYVRMRNRGGSAANGVTATVYWSRVSTLVTPGMWNLVGTSPPVNVPTGNTLVVAPGITWPSASIPAPGHYCFVALLDQAQDPAPPIPGPTDWTGFLDIIRNHNTVTWRNFHVVDVEPDPATDPVALRFVLAGAPGQARRFDLELAVNLPEDARLFLSLPAAAAGALPSMWRELLMRDRNGQFVLDVPRIRSNALCGLRLHADAAHECRFVLQPSMRLADGIHTIAIRQFDDGLQVGGITWALRPIRN